MSTPEEREVWEQAAKQRLADSKKEKKAEQERKELENLLRGEGVAAENEATAKRKAMQAWIGEGGTVTEFEKQWESLYKDMIYQRTLARMTKPGAGSGFKLSL